MPATDIPLRFLDTVKIASPCPMRWDDMEGDDRVRHCAQCDLNVYNLSSMTADEAESVLRSATGRLCAGFYRRADGTVLTRDCPVGLRALRQRTARVILRSAALIGFMLTGGVLARASTSESGGLRATQPFERLCAWLRPALPLARTPVSQRAWAAGAICAPPPPQTGSQPAPGPSQSPSFD